MTHAHDRVPTVRPVKAAAAPQPAHQPKMAKDLSAFTLFAVAFGFVSIATGIFTTYGSVLNSSGPLGIWTWPIVVIGQLAVALVFGALAARVPVTGYAYHGSLAWPTPSSAGSWAGSRSCS